MNAHTVSPVTLARMRAEGTVWRCLECDFIGIGRMTTYHTRLYAGHRLVTEREYDEAMSREVSVSELTGAFLAKVRR